MKDYYARYIESYHKLLRQWERANHYKGKYKAKIRYARHSEAERVYLAGRA